ncbi:hypothetical protein A0U40_14050 [[Bacillus] sp. KCTC 13219]|nr:hypothetical protein A0U40_14050 [[Bacillus] sp. KCTC 13219]
MKYIDYFEIWRLAYRTIGRRAATLNKYDNASNVIDAAKIGNKEIEDITRMDIQEFLNEYGRDKAWGTVNELYKIIKASFEDAVIDKYIAETPCTRIEINSKEKCLSVQELKLLRERKKWLEFDEYTRLKNYLVDTLLILLAEAPCESKKNRYKIQMKLIVIYIALKTGARFSEVLGLGHDDFDSEAKILNIDKTYDHKKYMGDIVPTKNVASIRKIMVDDECIELIELYKEWLQANNIKCAFDILLFVEHKINVHNSSVNETLKQIFATLKIEPLSFHKLRHTHASILIAKGVSVRTVAKRLGHTNIQMIEKVYGHLLQSVEESENEKILTLI